MSIRRILTRIAWYPVLLAVIFVIKPYATWDISPLDSARVLAIAIAVALSATIACTLLLGRDRGGALAAVVVMALAVAITPQAVLAFAAAIVLLLVEAALAARGRLTMRAPWPRVTEIATIAVVALICVQGVMAANVRLRDAALAAPSAWPVAAAGPRPDIYVVLADGHGRSDVLREGYGMDTAPLRDDLTNLGFVEAPASRANHMRTLWSLSVLLNGRPLSELGQDMSRPADPTVPPAALAGNAAFALLHGNGYRVIALDPGFAELHLTSADEIIDTGPFNELESAEVSETAIGNLLYGGEIGSFAAVGERVLRQADALATLAAEPHDGPRAVFAHLPSPHIPIVFDADCDLDGSIYDRLAAFQTGPRVGAERIAAVRDQTVCVDGLLSRLAHSVVDHDPEAIVIILSDHGPDDYFDWASPSEPGLDYRFANLFWSRTPNLKDPFPRDVSLVNIFPDLFNALWDLHLPTHPNDMFLGPTDAQPGFTQYVPTPGSGD